MNRDQNIFDTIERYLSGDLSSRELQDFETEMAGNLDLKKEVELHRSLHEELKDIDTLQFRKKIARIATNQNKDSKGIGSFWKIAASLLILVGLSTFLWFQLASRESDLFETYYRPYPVEDVVRGNTEKESDAILKGYSNREYREVIPKLEGLIAEDAENEVLKLYLGNSYLNTGQEDKAISTFNGITQESKYYEDAQWYLALTHAKLGNSQKASEYLKWIIDYNGLHKAKATELLQKLR